MQCPRSTLAGILLAECGHSQLRRPVTAPTGETAPTRRAIMWPVQGSIRLQQVTHRLLLAHAGAPLCQDVSPRDVRPVDCAALRAAFQQAVQVLHAWVHAVSPRTTLNHVLRQTRTRISPISSAHFLEVEQARMSIQLLPTHSHSEKHKPTIIHRQVHGHVCGQGNISAMRTSVLSD